MPLLPFRDASCQIQKLATTGDNVTGQAVHHVIPWHESTLIEGQSGAASWDGPWMDLRAYRFGLLQLQWSAVVDTAGLLTMQATVDPAQAAVNCYDITSTLLISFGTFTVGAVAGSVTVPLVDPWPYMRWRYARTGGGAASQFTGRLFARG